MHSIFVPCRFKVIYTALEQRTTTSLKTCIIAASFHYSWKAQLNQPNIFYCSLGLEEINYVIFLYPANQEHYIQHVSPYHMFLYMKLK